MRIDIGVDLHKTQFTVYARRETKPGESGQYATSDEGIGSFWGSWVSGGGAAMISGSVLSRRGTCHSR